MRRSQFNKAADKSLVDLFGTAPATAAAAVPSRRLLSSARGRQSNLDDVMRPAAMPVVAAPLARSLAPTESLYDETRPAAMPVEAAANASPLLPSSAPLVQPSNAALSRAASITPDPSQPGARAMGAEDIIRPQVLFPTQSPLSAIQRPQDRVSFHPTTLRQGSITDASKLLSDLEISQKAASAASSAAMAPVQQSSAAPSDSGAGVETDLVSRRQSRPLHSNAELLGLSKAQQARRTGARMGTPASAALSSAELIQPSAAQAQVLARDNAVSGAKNTMESIVSTLAARAATPSSAATESQRAPPPPFKAPPSAATESQRAPPPPFKAPPSAAQEVVVAPDDQTAARLQFYKSQPRPSNAAIAFSPPPSSADQSVLDRIRSLERELEECYKKVTTRESILKKSGEKNIAQREQIRVLEEQLQQARKAQQEQIRVLEQQLQQARQAQQVLDDDATSSNASTKSFDTAPESDGRFSDADEGGKRKTKFKKNKKMYNKTSKKYNKTSKKYKNKKARY